MDGMDDTTLYEVWGTRRPQFEGRPVPLEDWPPDKVQITWHGDSLSVVARDVTLATRLHREHYAKGAPWTT